MSRLASTAAVEPMRRARLWLEFAAIYLAAPLTMTTLVMQGVVSTRDLPTGFAAMFALAIVLLSVTPGFRWRALLTSHPLPDWRAGLAFALVTVGAVYAMVLWLVPWSLFGFPTRMTDLWMRVMIFYPILSVLPQGIIFRALFFARYEGLFPNRGVALLVNGALFGLGHLFFLNWVAVALTTIGGVAFAWAHAERKSFWFANLLHAIGGWTIFTMGLGVYFYHGAISPG